MNNEKEKKEEKEPKKLNSLHSFDMLKYAHKKQSTHVGALKQRLVSFWFPVFGLRLEDDGVLLQENSIFLQLGHFGTNSIFGATQARGPIVVTQVGREA